MNCAYVTHNSREWWYGHLTAALGRRIRVVRVPMAPEPDGRAPETDIREMLGVEDLERAFYLGSSDRLFRGVAELPMRTAVWTDWFPQSGQERIACFGLFDVVFSAQKDSLGALRQGGLRRVEWLPFAFDASLENKPAAAKEYDVGFVGSLEQPPTAAERRSVLSALEARFRMNDYRTPVFGNGMMRVYNASRLAVNIPAYGGLNMRTFEAMASGALLLTKPIGNGQADLFRDGEHYVSYRDTGDLLDKIEYYLRHEREREELAAHAREEVLARHTYEHRAARLLEVMSDAAPATTRQTDPEANALAYAQFYDYAGRADLLAAAAIRGGFPIRPRVRYLAKALLKQARLA